MGAAAAWSASETMLEVASCLKILYTTVIVHMLVSAYCTSLRYHLNRTVVQVLSMLVSPAVSADYGFAFHRDMFGMLSCLRIWYASIIIYGYIHNKARHRDATPTIRLSEWLVC